MLASICSVIIVIPNSTEYSVREYGDCHLITNCSGTQVSPHSVQSKNHKDPIEPKHRVPREEIERLLMFS